ncbi:MAG TPA: histidinol-phosphate transaminase [Prolixibacteraceae bacterium]|nr:histidinol-phosphate transaminase [Prolixibacteraceae bacterium]
MLTGHGNDIYQYDDEIIVDFSSNIGKTHIREKLLAFLQKKIKDINNYPEPEAVQLKKCIAKFHNVTVDEVVICNGSTEAFYLVAQTFSNKRSLIRIPSFSEYEDACSRYDHKIKFEVEITPETIANNELIWFGNPNNPDGKVTPLKTIEEWCNQFPDQLFVIDEAFGDLSNGFKSSISLVKKHANIVVIRSLTKSFSIPGLRLGYIIAKKDIVTRIKKYLIPWNINTLAIDAGVFIMNNYDNLMPDVKDLSRTCESFIKEMKKVKGVNVTPTASNFFIAELPKGTAAELKLYLLKNHGLLIRDASNFRGLTPQHFRVSVRSSQQNLMLVNAIQTWMNL